MRETGSTLSRLAALRALVAGAALFASATASRAVAQPDETAMAVPRLAPLGNSEVALLQPLDPVEADQFRALFAAQNAADSVLAERLMRALEAPAKGEAAGLRGDLRGYARAAGYLRPGSHPDPAALSAWLSRHSALAIAADIAALCRAHAPTCPAAKRIAPAPSLAALSAPEDALFDFSEFRRNPELEGEIFTRAESGQSDAALRLIAHTSGLSPDYAALLRAEVAEALFAANHDHAARDLALRAFHASGDRVALGGFVAGLASWRLNRFDEARRWFEAAAEAPIASPGQHAAARFWAARAHFARGDAEGGRLWLERASAGAYTFYGLLARRRLGLPLLAESDASAGVLGEADIAAVAETEAGMRAFALLQIGQSGFAGAELRALAAKPDTAPALRGAIARVAREAGLAPLADAISASFRAASGAKPLPHLAPRGGFQVAPALIYALARIESHFDPAAVSPAGARGLLQLMPVTASYLANDPSLAGARQQRLHDPAVNLDLGQRYLVHLSRVDVVDGDLLRLLAAYNAGPGNLANWLQSLQDGDDPLMFIEAVPSHETRGFLRRAFAYAWLYAARLDVAPPGLASLAEGRFPRLESSDRLAFPAEAAMSFLPN
jgi:soluble lytic murein transglycosylase-like protein